MEAKIAYRVISTSQLVRAIKEGQKNSERFCFIIGAGASESSGIPTGRTLAYRWMKKMLEQNSIEEIRQLAKKLRAGNQLEYCFDEIEKAWQNARKKGKKELPSKYYSDVYKLRFFPNNRNGYSYLEKAMCGKVPGFGYRVLAQMLTDKWGSNLVITTNFDNLVEEAVSLYTKCQPIVINHEALADYAINMGKPKPIIAKIHRGLFFDPLNDAEETKELKGRWRTVLSSILTVYTPIVIGYGGGDKSLMELLQEEELKFKNGIYWCYMEDHGIPRKEIQNIIIQKGGYFVSTAGFDALMLKIGNEFYSKKIDIESTAQYLRNKVDRLVKKYIDGFNSLQRLTLSGEEESAKEYIQEIEKLNEREQALENKRLQENNLTAWDYRRQGDKYYANKQYKEAIACFSKAIARQPDTALFYDDRAHAYVKKEEYDKAIADYNKAIELDPTDPVTFYSLGNAYGKLGMYNNAIINYVRAIELDPMDADTYNNLGVAYKERKDYEAAIENYNKALELNPNDPGIIHNRLVASTLKRENEVAGKDKTVENNNGEVIDNLRIAMAAPRMIFRGDGVAGVAVRIKDADVLPTLPQLDRFIPSNERKTFTESSKGIPNKYSNLEPKRKIPMSVPSKKKRKF